MIEEADFETFLYLSRNQCVIFVENKRTFKSLYKEEIKIADEIYPDDLNYLSKFIDGNIYRIEKLVGNFIKDITLIIENDKILNVDIGIKKKDHTQFLNQDYLKNDLIEVKDLFKASYQNQVIMHMLIINYDEDGNKNFSNDFDENNLYTVVKFISISNSLTSILDKLLEKHQIQINQYMSGEYIKNFIGEDLGELSMMASKLKNGFNKNEITFVGRDIDLLQSKQLSEALKENTSLISISLISNKIGDDGVKALAEALKENTSIMDMTLEPNGNRNEINTEEITEYMRRNRAMHAVNIGRSKDPDNVEITLLFALNKIKFSCNNVDELSNSFITSMGLDSFKDLPEKNIANIPSKLFPNEEEAKLFANKVIEILNNRKITLPSGDEIIETTDNVKTAMNNCLKPKTSIFGKIHAYLTEDGNTKNQDPFLRVD